SGQAVIWLTGPNAMMTAAGASFPSDLMFVGEGMAFPGNLPSSTNQEATVITVQNGATANLTNATLTFDGPPGFQPASEMALCVGGCGLSGAVGDSITPGGVGGNASLNNVDIIDNATQSAGIWVSRTGTMTMTGGSITLGPNTANSQ